MSKERSRAKRSPIKDRPHRNPGDSIRDRMLDVIFDRVMLPLLGTIFFGALALMEWTRLLTHSEPSPRTLTGIALAAASLTAWRVWKSHRELEALRQGRRGELAVGQYLDEEMRPRGGHTFHDYPGEGFNIDHILVHPTGVYALETKTYSKPDDGKVIFDGETLSITGLKPERDPVQQARANAKWLADLIKTSTGKRVYVRPVVLFPGWWVETTEKGRLSEVWVLEPKQLPARIQQCQAALPDDVVTMVKLHLSKYARSIE